MSRLDHFARGLLPLLCTLAVVLIGAVPTRLPMFELVAPALTLAAVYYWSIYRPDLLNAFFILLLGVLQDLLIGGPVGVSSFVLLLTYLVVVTQRKFFHGKSFSVVWWGFMLIALGAGVMSWTAHTLLAMRWIDPAAPALGLLLTILFYPPMAALMSQAHKLIPAREMDL